MDQEQSWVTTETVGDDDNTAATNYQYFMRPEPRDNLGPIYRVDDPYLGKGTPVRDLRIGMTRNAKEENKRAIRAYLVPYPHTRIEDAKPLQGWYQSKLNESAASRPRPCFTEAVLTEPYGGWCAVGCAFSLPAGEPVDTPFGPRPIESFRVGDYVYGRTRSGRYVVKVTGTSRHRKPEGLVVVVLNDGRRLRMTGDHPVYSPARGWVAAETLDTGEELEDANLSTLRRGNSEREVLSAVLVGEEQRAEGADSELPGLFGPVASSGTDRLRRLQSTSQGGQREIGEGEAERAEGRSQVGRDEGRDVGRRVRPAGKHVGTGEGSEVAGVPAGSGGGRAERGVGVPPLEARRLHLPEGADVQHEVGVGAVDGRLLRPEGVGLGLRAVLDPAPRRVGLRAGLPTDGVGVVGGGEGLHVALLRGEDQPSPPCGLRGRGVRQGAVGEVGRPHVVRVERVPGDVEVFDIETETGNFYQRGVLVHNCYVNSGFRGYRGTGLITVPIGYGKQIAGQLTKMRRAAAGYFSSFTDPFTPLEDYYHNTREAAEEFVKVGLPLFFLSRLRYPEWAVELLRENPHSYAQKSINTPDPEDWRRLSPGALPLADHLEDIARLKAAGIYVSIQCNPIVPGITSHSDVLRLFKMLRDAGADHVIVKFVEAGYSWAPAMVERMVKRFGDRGREFERLFTQNIGSQRTVEEEYRIRGHRLYSAQARRLGLTFSTCYEYEYERDAAGNVLSKTGVSVGRKFATSSQCHGQSVPVYTRNDENELFRPVEECPPSGCLYCADENEEAPGKPRCGDLLAGEANALKFADLRVPIGQGVPRNLIQLEVRKRD